MRRLVPVLAVLVALTGSAVARADGTDPTNPFRGQVPFLDCQAGHDPNAGRYNPWPYVWKYRREGRAADARLIEKLAKVPTAKWFAGDSVRPSPSRMVERYLARVDDPQVGGSDCRTSLRSTRGLPSRADYLKARRLGHAAALSPVPRDSYVGGMPVLVLRAMVHAKCGGDQGAGRWNDTGPRSLYKPWIDAFAASVDRTWNGPFRYEFWAKTPWPRSMFEPVQRHAAVILEPDALGLISNHSTCSDARSKRNTLALLSYAAQKLGAVPGLSVYVDAGSSAWVDALENIRMLRAAGIRYVRGFALNSTHFNDTPAELRYGNWMARYLGGNVHYVVNTAENANGALPKRLWNPKVGSRSMWCNPKNAGLGRAPTTNTGSPYADAFLWVSRPGLSSNGKNGKAECGRGPLDNVFWPERALEEARQANFAQPAWPPKPM